MVSPSINKKLISFLFLNTLDLEYSIDLLKNTLLKLHSKNEKLNEEDVFKTTLKKVLLKSPDLGEITLDEFTKSCKQVFESHEGVNFHSWFLFFKNSIRQERETFILSQVLKMSDSEISELQSLTAGTVRSRISSCYNKLNEAVKNG